MLGTPQKIAGPFEEPPVEGTKLTWLVLLTMKDEWWVCNQLWVTARIWTRLSSQTQFSPGGVTAASKMFTLSGSARQEVLTCIFSQNKQFCTWTDWWLTDCVSWPVSKRRRPVVLPGHSALTVPHQVPQAAFSSQVHIAAFARLALSNGVFAPVFCKPWWWPVSIFTHLLKLIIIKVKNVCECWP